MFGRHLRLRRSWSPPFSCPSTALLRARLGFWIISEVIIPACVTLEVLEIPRSVVLSRVKRLEGLRAEPCQGSPDQKRPPVNGQEYERANAAAPIDLVVGFLMAWMVREFERPPSVILGWLFGFRPRFEFLPRVMPKVNCSVVKLSSRIFPSMSLGELLLEILHGCYCV